MKKFRVLIIGLVFSAVFMAEIDAAKSAGFFAHPNSITAEIGYFAGRRKTFRDLYGYSAAFGLTVWRDLGSRIGLSLRTGFAKQDRSTLDEDEFSFTTLQVVPMATYRLLSTGRIELGLGGGLGPAFRRVVYRDILTNGFEEWSVKMHKDEYGVVAVASVGGVLSINQHLGVGARLYYDRHLTGDARTGDFGDTGGFYLLGTVGFAF